MTRPYEELCAPAAFGVGGSGETLRRAWVQVAPAARAVARRFTDDPDFRQDLIQEARIALWRIDPTRFDLHSARELQFLRRMVTNRMWAVWQAEQGKGLVKSGAS